MSRSRRDFFADDSEFDSGPAIPPSRRLRDEERIWMSDDWDEDPVDFDSADGGEGDPDFDDGLDWDRGRSSRFAH